VATTAKIPRRLISLTEAADALGVSTKTVRRYIAAGDLDAVRLGRRTIRIRLESLDKLIDAHPVNTWARAAGPNPLAWPRSAGSKGA
jgi:excisionase family DNA binding protein